MLDREKGNFPLQDRRVAVQEYGVSNPELLAGLEQRGARVFPVCVYEWALPEDTGPLQAAVTLIIGGEIQVMLVAPQSRYVIYSRLPKVWSAQPNCMTRCPGRHRLDRTADLGRTAQSRPECGYRMCPSEDGISCAGAGRKQRTTFPTEKGDDHRCNLPSPPLGTAWPWRNDWSSNSGRNIHPG